MPKSRGRRNGRSSKRGHPGGRPTQRHREEPGLLDEVRSALAEGHPLGLLTYASGLLNAMDSRNNNPFDRSADPEVPTVAELLDTLVASGEPEAAALAWTMAHLHDDELARTRTLRALRSVAADLPPWMPALAEVQVVGAEQFGDVLRDSLDVVVHARLAGQDVLAVTLIDFNLGTIVKDAFFTDQSLEGFSDIWHQQQLTGITAIEPLSLADARVRLSDAIDVGSRTWPPAETDSWPAGRPLLEWLVGQMPTGGVEIPRPEWSKEETDRLRDRFLTSPYAPVPLGPDDAAIVDDLLWYRTGYGYGDPLRWSPTAVEILLLDWYPRKIVADPAYLRRMPTVLGHFVRFGHAEAGIDDELTVETRDALASLTADYEKAISTPRRQGPEALLERMGALDPLSQPGDLDVLLEDENDELIDEADLAAFDEDMLAELVGGHAALADLSTEPLPDEPFAEQGIAANVLDLVTKTVTLADACCEELLDLEHRTAVRRLLHDVAVRDPASFAGRATARTGAAAACWLVGRANQTVGVPGGVATGDLAAWFGLKSPPGTRAGAMRRTLGVDDLWMPGALGSARYVTGTRRAEVLAARDQ